MSIHGRIKQARLDMGLTQSQLADLCGLRQPAINKYETGAVKTISEAQLKRMAEALNRPVSWFYGEGGPAAPGPLARLVDEVTGPDMGALTPRQVKALQEFFMEFKRAAAGARREVPHAHLIDLNPKEKEEALKEHALETKIHKLPVKEVQEKAAAGRGVYADSPPEPLLLAQHRWAKGYKPFKIVGESMAPYIMDGDYVVVDLKRGPVNGDTVLARTGDGLVVKQFFKKADHVELVSVNPEFEPVSLKEVAVLGVLIDIVRPVKKIVE